MVIMVRVDDRLLHGQIICSWVPYTGADALIVASDEASSDAILREIMCSCAHKGLRVDVLPLDEAVREIAGGVFEKRHAILIVADLKDAMRAFELGMRFQVLNIGNIHHGPDGRAITPSVIVDPSDEEIIGRFEALGVRIDIRDVPASDPVTYVSGKREGA